ncbi:hypothetical protein [Anaplasma phagocytophilum]|uniref:hypothetical protein n=1 Tax=Anaplasma phagocytophilum TaxID=948 RepID=UPI00201A557E
MWLFSWSNRKIVGKILAIFGLASALFLVITCFTGKRDAYNKIRKRCAALRKELYSNRIKLLILERRVKDHFSLFCLGNTINLGISQGLVGFANCNVEKSRQTCIKVYRGVLVLTIVTMFALVVFKWVSESHVLKPETAKSVDVALGVTLLVFCILAAYAMKFVFSEYMRSWNKLAKKLSKALEREGNRYCKLVSGIETYNNFPEHIKYGIRVSDHFTSLVMGRILSGALTSKAAQKILKAVEDEMSRASRLMSS